MARRRYDETHTPEEEGVVTANDPVENVARAILYEGFMLYPYRGTSLKNIQRWNFGVLYPPEYCARHSSERSFLQTEVLARGTMRSVITARILFLQKGSADEVVERDVSVNDLDFASIFVTPRQHPVLSEPLEGNISVGVRFLGDDIWKVTLGCNNSTPGHDADRDSALRGAFISAVVILTIRDGEFYSLIDPPPSVLPWKSSCCNIGMWPVLAGREGRHDRILSAPIILYDYPSIAPESHGDFFDGTEIDEMLSLRVLTLTDEEKVAMKLQGERTRDIVERTEMLDREGMLKLHGAVREGGFRRGDRVMLRPKRRADIFDLALSGRLATVVSEEQDLDGNEYLCVTVDDDPGNDLGMEAKPGHRFFFGFDEVERV